MKLATTTGDFNAYTSSQEESMQYIREAGFQYLDYNFGMDYNRKNGIFSTDWKQHLNQILKQTESLQVNFVQAHAPMGDPIIQNAAHADFMEANKRCIECSAALGIKNLVIHSGYEQGLSRAQTFERNRLFYQELLSVAECFGVNILVENFNKMCIEGMYWIDCATDLREMVDFVNHPLFHACWDAGHGNLQEMPQDEELRILGEHVYALHVQDNLGNTDSHMAPFFGSLNLDSLMHGLIDIGYKGYFTFESGNIFLPASQRRAFTKDDRLLQAPLSLKKKAEGLLYEIGKVTLEAYGCFEE